MTPFVLIPGFMLDAGMWDDVRPALEAIAPVSFGNTAEDASIEAMAQRTLAGAPPRFVLIGFSMGGYVAREVVRTAPGRVAALILIGTSARGDTPARAARKSAAAAAARTTFRGLSRAAVARAVHPSRVEDGALLGRLQLMGDRLGGDVFQRQTALRRDGDAGRLGEIRCPTLVIAASDDALRSMEETRELQAGIPGAELAVVAGSGHMIPMEQPAALAALIAGFLRRAIPG